MLLVFVVFSACSSEPTPHQAEAKKKDATVQKDFQSVMDVSSVTEKTRQVYRRYCAQCHGVKDIVMESTLRIWWFRLVIIQRVII